MRELDDKSLILCDLKEHDSNWIWNSCKM